VFCAVNSMLRQRRRHLVVLLAVLALASAVVTAHSLMSHDHMSDVVVACLAVAETAVVALGTTLALGARAGWRSRLLPPLPAPRLALVVTAVPARARAGPPLLQVFRL
jgi:hypothetical protein